MVRENLQRRTVQDLAAVPAELRAAPQWVVWAYRKREDGKLTKVPFQALDPQSKASSTNPATWASADDALACYEARNDYTKLNPQPWLSGVGVVMTPDMGMVGFDLDDVRNPDTGEIQAWALELVNDLNTYTEVSPSGRGLRVFAKGTLEHLSGHKRGPVEVYTKERYLTITGARLAGTPATINEAQAAIDRLHARYVAKPERERPTSTAKAQQPANLDDQEVLAAAFKSRNGAAIRNLWEGDTSGHDNDQSRADLALCSHLAFFADYDVHQVDRLFRQSALMRGKWDELRGDATYGERTISEATAGKRPGDGYRGRGLARITTSRNGGEEGEGIPFEALLARAQEATMDTLPRVLNDLTELADSNILASQREAIFKALKDATGVTLKAIRSDYAALLSADGEPAERETISERLLALVLDKVELWRDLDGEPHITLISDTHREHHRLNTRAVKRWIQREWYEAEGGALGREPLSEALGVLEGKAVHDGEEHRTFIRVAELGDGANTTVYIDIGDDTWHALEVTASGWRTIQSAEVPVRFIRSSGMLPLPTPQPGSIDDLAAAITVPRFNEDGTPNRAFQGMVAWLLQATRVDGPFPILALNGQHGAAKSSRTRQLCSLLDPHTATLRVLSRDDRDLLIAARHSWLQAKDNVSGLTGWQSDAFCRLATGGAISTRTLYTDGEETILNAKRPVTMNGIVSFVERLDLVDRTILATLPHIPEDARLPESELDADYEARRPKALGALLDVISSGLARSGTRHLQRLPRMADFAEWIVACCPALGWDPEDFLDWYANTRVDLERETLDSAPIVAPLLALISEAGGNLELIPSELLAELERVAGLDGDKKKRTPKDWPKRARDLSNQLNRLAPSLQQVASIKAEHSRTNDSRQWRFTKLDNPASPASPRRWLRQEAPSEREEPGDDEISAQRHPASPSVTTPDPDDDGVTMTSDPASPQTTRSHRHNDAGDAGDAGLPTLREDHKSHAPRDALSTLAQELAELNLPSWWATKATAEPEIVRLAIQLAREAQAAGTRTGPSNTYLVEAAKRLTAEAPRREPRTPPPGIPL